MALSVDLASARDARDEATAKPTKAAAEALADAHVRDVVAMGVGAVMALHTVDAARARVALGQMAVRHQVPIYDLVQAVLGLVSGTDEPFDDNRASRAAAELFMQGFTAST